jgi:hypothetical protein
MAENRRHDELVWSQADLRIRPAEVAWLAGAGPQGGCAEVVAEAIAEARDLVTPRGRWTKLSSEEVEGVFPSHTPVSEIARRGEVWAFVATVGPVLEEKVRQHFSASCFLEGVLLDAAGSAAAEATAGLVEQECGGGRMSERFSPGYCGWVMDAQTALFELLEPTAFGVELLPGFLMHPLKSVSGIVVRAPSSGLRIAPQYCRQCDAKGCDRRQARYRPSPAPARR